MNAKINWVGIILFLVVIVVVAIAVSNLISNFLLPEEVVKVSVVPPTPSDTPIDPTGTLIPTPTVTNTSSPTPFAKVISTGTSNYNCTFPASSWKENPEAWFSQSFRVGNVIYDKQQVLDILSDQSDDVSINLLQQLVTVVLNQQNGADPNAVLTTLNTAIEWLGEHPVGSPLSDSARQEALAMIEALKDFNSGVTGPGLCSYKLSASTATSTLTPSAISSPTSNLPTHVYIAPSPVPTRTPRPPRSKPPTATHSPPTKKPPTVQPTEAPKPPTAAPSPKP